MRKFKFADDLGVVLRLILQLLLEMGNLIMKISDLFIIGFSQLALILSMLLLGLVELLLELTGLRRKYR